MFSSLEKNTTIDSTLEYDIYSPNKKRGKEEEQMIKDIYMCYGGAGATSAGTPQTMCQTKRMGAGIVGTEMSLASAASPDGEPNWGRMHQLYIGSITVVGLFILFRVLQRSY